MNGISAVERALAWLIRVMARMWFAEVYWVRVRLLRVDVDALMAEPARQKMAMLAVSRPLREIAPGGLFADMDGDVFVRTGYRCWAKEACVRLRQGDVHLLRAGQPVHGPLVFREDYDQMGRGVMVVDDGVERA